MPPCWGGTQVRIRLRDPRPQLREHRLQDPHSSHTPCTARKHGAVAGPHFGPAHSPSAHQSGAPAVLRPLLIGSALDPRTQPFERVCMTWVSIPTSHRIPPVDTQTGNLGSIQKGSQGSSPGGTGKPRKGYKIYPHPIPHYPSPALPTPKPRAGSQHGRRGARQVPLQPQAHEHTNRHESLHRH